MSPLDQHESRKKEGSHCPGLNTNTLIMALGPPVSRERTPTASKVPLAPFLAFALSSIKFGLWLLSGSLEL